MIRQSLAVLMGWMLVVNSGQPAFADEQKPSLKQQVLDMPAGAYVEVRTVNKEKVRGWLGDVSNEGFAVKTTNGLTAERQVNFSDVKSIRAASVKDPSTGAKVGSTAGKTVIGLLAGLGVFVLILAVVAAGRS